MSKRKRQGNNEHAAADANGSHAKIARSYDQADVKTPTATVQVVTGSYEKALHGITVSISDLSSDKSVVEFADTFLFTAHDASIRCLAVSPLPDSSSDDAQNVLLATGGSDEKINVYTISASPTSDSSKLPAMPTIGNNKVNENPRNRELGSLLQHSSNITSLHFPTRSKLISASEDNTIAISRTRDLLTVSTVKAPRPKAFGQPSGDTAPQGATPAGVNDFAVHPSMKLMVSIGRGERCMRLWNLVTGKKAGVLNFSKEMLQSVKEGKYSSGEGRRIRWNRDGSEFAVAFERGVIIFGEDSRPKRKVLPMPLTKIHQMSYFKVTGDGEEEMLVVSTEDGRIVFYEADHSEVQNEIEPDAQADVMHDARIVAQLGGKAAGLSGRIKDFEVLSLNNAEGMSSTIVVTASSDGAVRVWRLRFSGFPQKEVQTGQLVGTYETGNRITCLEAFVMLPPNTEDDIGLSEFEGLSEAPEESTSDSDDSDGNEEQ